MIDPTITDEDFGRDFLGGKSAKTARRRIIDDRIPYYRDRGHFLILLSDAEVWRKARMKTPAAPDLKSMLREISDRALTKVQRRAS